MPKRSVELGALAIKRLISPGVHQAGGVAGLRLQVKDSGARSWLFRIMVGDRRRDIGLGAYPEVSLAMARDKARLLRDKVVAGIDPVEERRAARAALRAAKSSISFDEAARRWHKSRKVEYRNAKHAAQVLSTLNAYASPVFGNLPVGDVSLRHVLGVLESIWTTKTETATRLRGRIENVLTWATVSGYRTGENPARWKGGLDALLPKPGKISRVEHHRALPIDAVPAFFAQLRTCAGTAARALEFAILTAARSGEVRGASWPEFDLEAAVWTIPGERIKAGREHRVPLVPEAISLVRALPRFPNVQFAFAAAHGSILSDLTLSGILRRMQVDAVPHGFRSSFRDWAAERTNFTREVVEMALAHAITNKVEAAYRRGDLLEKRRTLMEEWARFLASERFSTGTT